MRIKIWLQTAGLVVVGLWLSLSTERGASEDAIEATSPPAVYQQVVSPFGRAFAAALSRRWRETASAAAHRIVIREAALPQAGTYLWVLLDGEIIYRLHPIPQHQTVEGPVGQALKALRAKLSTAPPEPNSR